MGVPAAPIIAWRFQDLAEKTASSEGMPHERFTYIPHPVSNKPPAECRIYLEGNDPLTHKPVVEEIVTALTAPLNEEEKKTGFVEQPRNRFLKPDTAENLQRHFLENGQTDGLLIVLPTEEKVSEMLSGTSRKPDELVGQMRPSPAQPGWKYTVEMVAVNAVMAGAKSKHFPLILALAATGQASIPSSTSSMARMMIINGPIRNELGFNMGIGALGPFNEASAVIGRTWTFITKNLGGGGKAGTTYLGTLGTNFNYNNICFAEREEALPPGWKPFHMQKGFKQEESVVSVFNGWTLLNYSAYNPDPYHQLMRRQMVALEMSGAGAHHTPGVNIQTAGLVIMDPLVAKALKEREGFETKEKLNQWLTENVHFTMWNYWNAMPDDLRKAKEGIEPFASLLERSPESDSPLQLFRPNAGAEIAVVGGGTNPYWYAGDFRYLTSASVDEWR
jgi:hypothetical protein